MGRRLILSLLLVYALVCALMFTLQRQLQYRPDPTPLDPALAARHGFVQETLPTPDGERLLVWWAPPPDARAPVVLYLHGNGASLAARAGRLAALHADGSGVLALSWRGYGGSSGRPTEAGLMTDARAAWAELERRAPRHPTVIFGESLGTTVAVLLAAEVQPDALVLDSSFDSALAVAQGAYPWLPVPLLLRDTYRADLAAPRVQAPVLQVHCRDDPVTPLPHAQALNALLPHALPLVRLEQRCHVPPYASFRAEVQALLSRRAPGPGAGTAPR
ncbi:MAG: alpha/beta hydrolase [Rubrivivax sp.]